jgi:hypothetical protein
MLRYLRVLLLIFPRFYSRYFLVGKLGSPDWVMLVALVSVNGSMLQ